MKNKELKKSLAKKHKTCDKTFILNEKDFDSCGKLTACSYTELKERSKYLNKKEQIIINIPKKNTKDFIQNLEENVVQEIAFLDNEIKMIWNVVALLFLANILNFTITNNYLTNLGVFHEMLTVLFWVFQFAITEKIFFEYPVKRLRIAKLLQLARAEVVSE